MTHELKKIILAYEKATAIGTTSVLATVVALEGSSYRRPGVRMLLLSDGKMIGAVSGGCVEKEIWRQSQQVFESKIPKVMTYDGRYRLGCEGILYILIEPFEPDKEFIDAFWQAVKERQNIQIRSYFERQHTKATTMASVFNFTGNWMAAHPGYSSSEDLSIFEQQMEPCHRLVIIGAEHDAVQLCSYAAMTGWEVTIVAGPSEEKTISDFPGANEFYAMGPEDIGTLLIDKQTSLVLMTHSYVKDLSFLLNLSSITPKYLGLLGPAARREKLLNELLERHPEANMGFIDSIRGPAGLDLGSETPQEIALSILSEILSVNRGRKPLPLRDKSGSIHNS